MKKWEYMVVMRTRGWLEREGEDCFQPEKWRTKDPRTGSWVEDLDMEKLINEYGEQGWELVTVIAESGVLGGVSYISGSLSPKLVGLPGQHEGSTIGEFRDFAGYTNTEKWAFKRPKS